MSVDSRPALRGIRRPKKEPERVDFSEPDFSSWAAKLDAFVPPTAGAASSKVAAPEAPAPAPVTEVAVAIPVAETAVAVADVPVAEVRDDRPSLESVLEGLLSFDGAMAVALVDSETGMVLGNAGSGIDMDLAAAGASVILRARLASVQALGSDERIDDVLISLTSQVQIIHPLPGHPTVFTYLIGDKSRSSLAMARYKATEADLLIQL